MNNEHVFFPDDDYIISRFVDANMSLIRLSYHTYMSTRLDRSIRS